MWKSMFIFCPRAEVVNVPVMCQVEFNEKNMSRRKVRAFLNLKKSLMFCAHSFSLCFSSDLPCYRGEYLVWNAATASFCRNSLVCSASDQVSTSKSGSQIASPPLLFFFFFLHIFEDEAFCVSTGYSSLWCPFSPVCRKQ